MPNARKQDRELDALYASLPKLDCQGYCHESCGPIGMSVRERTRILERSGPVRCDKHASCSMLTADRRCGVYEIRPMVCRLWGIVRSMPCPYGCRPEGGFLSDKAGLYFLAEADRIGGNAGPGEFKHLLDELLATMEP